MHDLLSIGLIPETVQRIGWNEHAVWKIIYYTHGTGVLKIGDQDFQFEPGDIICQPPNIPHSEFSENGFRNIYFSVNRFADFDIPVPRFKDTINKDFYNILVQIHNEYHIKRPNWRNITEALLDALYQYMISWNLGRRKNPLVENFENILVSNIASRNFKMEHAIRSLPLSEAHFRYLFKKETGKTPLEYLNNKKIDYARQLIESRSVSNITIKEIASLVGFDDPYYFSRVFKKVTGKSPTDWYAQNAVKKPDPA